jgi:hypothetical protein
MAVEQFAGSMMANEYFTPLKGSIGKSAEGVCTELRAFPKRIRIGIESANRAVKLGEKQDLKLSLVFQVDESELSAAMKVATEGVTRAVGRA